MPMLARAVFSSALGIATAASGSNAGIVQLRGLMREHRANQTPTDAYNAASAGFLDKGVGSCVMHDGTAPAVQTVTGLTCAPFCAISLNCMGYTKLDGSCKLFMSGPLRLGAGDAPGHCYIKANPGIPFGNTNQTALHARDVKLLAGRGRARRGGASRTGGYNNVGEGMCEMEDGSEPQMEMHEMETAAECAEACDSDSTCEGYSATEGGCLIYQGGPLHANGMDAQDGFQCFQKVPDEAPASEGAEDAGPPEPPALEFGSDEERALAGEYAEHWQEKEWTSDDCHEGETYPFGTQQAINQVCTDNPDPAMPEGHQCECMVAKAHSCYVLCLPDMGVGDDAEYKWNECMADCYPTPTCKWMCGGATAACKPNCVQSYGRVSAIFKDVFQGISNNNADFQAATDAR